MARHDAFCRWPITECAEMCIPIMATSSRKGQGRRVHPQVSDLTRSQISETLRRVMYISDHHPGRRASPRKSALACVRRLAQGCPRLCAKFSSCDIRNGLDIGARIQLAHNTPVKEPLLMRSNIPSGIGTGCSSVSWKQSKARLRHVLVGSTAVASL